jgi:sec-independent protein translocase protein TatC
LSWAPDRYTTIITPTYYMAFVTRFLLACGIVFELPAATYVCAKLELIDASVLKKYRRHAIVVNTIVAAAITPSPDPFSMLLLAVPLIGMYELSIIIARYVNPTTEVTAHELAREEDEGQVSEEDVHDDEADDLQIDGFEETDDHPENGHERDL